MYGLIDCNNFFVSCERVFNPMLTGSPVVVLSNNDGCAVAISNEAKAIGIKRGDPYFKIEPLCKSNGVFVISGNHRLYGDMSKRVFTILRELMPYTEVYSIDEAFFMVPESQNRSDLSEIGRSIVTKIRRCTGIPTSVGIAPTRTLAKVATRFAKKYPAYRCACIIDNDKKRIKALSLTDIAEIWGIGRRLEKKLRPYGISTALDFASLPEHKIRTMFNNINVEHTWRELNGIPQNSSTAAVAHKQQICSSRSFAEPITDLAELSQAVSAFASTAARKLRTEKACAKTVAVYIRTNRFCNNSDSYSNEATVMLEEHTSDTFAIASAAQDALRKIFKPGIQYKKASVILSDIVEQTCVHHSLFTSPAIREKRDRLMAVIDNVNASAHTYNSISLASKATNDQMSYSEMPSRLYTTQMRDIININTR